MPIVHFEFIIAKKIKNNQQKAASIEKKITATEKKRKQ
jgi:hypothetical protein